MSKKTDKKPRVFRRTLHYYWQEVKKYKGYSILLFVTTPIVVFVRDILGPLIFAEMVQKISDGIPAGEEFSTLLPPAMFYLACYVGNSLIISEIRLWATWKMELLAMKDLGSMCFDVVSAQSMQFHSDRFSGSLVNQVNKFVGSFERLIDAFVWNIWYLISEFIFVFVLLFPKAPIFAAVLLALVIVYACISGFSYRRIAELNEAEASANNKATGQLADAITNITSVKSYAREKHESKRYRDFLQNVINKSFNLMHATIKRDFWFMGINSGIVILLLIFMMGGTAWFGLSVGTLLLLISYSQRVMGELWDINHIFKDMNRVFGDAHDMTEILDLLDDVVDMPGAKQLKLEKAEIGFENISFKHKDAKEKIFENFSLDIKPGERVGLVGVSGSGKTTLTKLLLRFADVNEGKITIDGQDIKYLTQESLRKNIAYVPQETSLFHRSLFDNIAYGRPTATKEEVYRAAKLANADEFIKDLPNGYDTLVGERGVKLSGGQRQRVAIARAILKDAPILVLDEATSALDSESEALIQDALKKLMKGRTSIVIAHRLSTIANLDRIVVLEDGKIAEMGSHKELLKKPRGQYKHLWSRQSGAFLDED